MPTATPALPAPAPAPARLGEVSAPVQVVSALDVMSDIEVLFRAPRRSCVVVHDAQGGRVGLLTRHRYTEVMTGRLGYGRAVMTRREVGRAADWAPLVLDAGTSVVDAARAAMARDATVRHDDVLVPGPSWSAASTADLVQALTSALADRAARDPLTGVLSRAHLVATTTQWAAGAVPGTRRRLLLVGLDVDGMAHLNASAGLDAGDDALRTVASRLCDAAPAGCVVGRIDGDAFGVLVLLPAVYDDRATELAATLGARLVGACAGLPVTLRATTSTSLAGWADPGLLLLEVERGLRSAPRASAPAGLPTRDRH
ncbi:diguanylate cyclase domain-containing protein [Cellulomonas shaoxiangyii]|uniref:diguanylate cyclase domain-containing protein n=1 Tax=Cellulomonas shaoxiangyii TaxID=2566013 RepID=UPI001407902A|nr:diguanylate cyclase [Cellulomonas shaoxiangyii]